MSDQQPMLDSSKSLVISVRLSLNDYSKLMELVKLLKIDKSKVVRNAIEIYYKLVKKSNLNLTPTNVRFEKIELGLDKSELEEIKKEIREIKNMLQSTGGSTINVKGLKRELEKLKSLLRTYYKIANSDLEKKRYQVLYKQIEMITSMLI